MAMATREDWMRRLGPLYGGAVALVASTSWRWPTAVAGDARSPGWVVMLGLPIGVVGYVAAMLAQAIGLPLTVAAVAGLAALAVASAGLVESGVVERLDRVHAHSPTVKSVLVLAFGVVARVSALAALPFDRWLGVLVAMAVVGRWAAVFLQALGDPIVDHHVRRSLVVPRAPVWLVAATGIGVATITVLAIGPKPGVAALAFTAAATFGLGVDAQRRDRGLSAPVVACAAAAGELCVLLVATIA